MPAMARDVMVGLRTPLRYGHAEDPSIRLCAILHHDPPAGSLVSKSMPHRIEHQFRHDQSDHHRRIGGTARPRIATLGYAPRFPEHCALRPSVTCWR